MCMAQNICGIVGADDCGRLAAITDERSGPLKHHSRLSGTTAVVKGRSAARSPPPMVGRAAMALPRGRLAIVVAQSRRNSGRRYNKQRAILLAIHFEFGRGV
jgi:hypothetical protein